MSYLGCISSVGIYLCCVVGSTIASDATVGSDEDSSTTPPQPVERPPRGEPSPYETTAYGTRPRLPSHAIEPTSFTTPLTWVDPPAGTDLAAMLQAVPGLRIRDTGTGGRKTLALRGSNGHQIAVFLDEVRLTSPGRETVDLSLFDPIHLGGADIHRSGNSAQYGTHAIGGALVLHSRPIQHGTHLHGSLAYGAWNTFKGQASFGSRIAQWRYIVSGSYGRGDGDFTYVDHNGQSAKRLNNDFQRGQSLVKLDYVGASTHTVVMNAFSLSDSGAPGPSQSPSSTARQAYLQNLTALTTTIFDTLVSDGRTVISVSHRYGNFRFDDPVGPPPVLSRNQTFGIGGKARLELPFSDTLRFETGVDIREEIFRDPSTSNPTRFESDLWVSNQTYLLQRPHRPNAHHTRCSGPRVRYDRCPQDRRRGVALSPTRNKFLTSPHR